MNEYFMGVKMFRTIESELQAWKERLLHKPLFVHGARQVGINEKKFKLLFLDIGLVKYSCGLDMDTLLNKELFMINQGALAEQFVGQELIAYGACYKQPQLYYWEREKSNAQAEVNYVIHIGPDIFPVEVKSGKTGRMKSLQVFLDEKGFDIGVRISQHQLSIQKRILSVPLYMISELPRLLKQL